MGEAIASISAQLIEQAPLLFLCILTCLAEFLWYKHAIKVIENMAEKSIEEIRKTYKDAYSQRAKVKDK